MTDLRATTKRPDWLIPALASVVALLWVLWCSRYPFFWDNILNAKLALWYLENGTGQLVPPESMDAGHPPFFNIYLAGCWAIFGKSLLVAHLAMLPFLLGIVWTWWNWCKRYLSAQYAGWGMLILVVQPTFLAQSSLLSPDVALVCFFLMALDAALRNREWVLTLAVIGMASVSFRGILMVPSVFLTAFVVTRGWNDWPKTIRHLFSYLPVGALVLAWFWYHVQVQGWLLSPPAETYGSHREVMGITGILRNLGILGWRWLDYGMVFIWIFLFIAPLLHFKKLKSDYRTYQLTLVVFLPTLWLALLLIPFSNPIGHRYFTAHFLLLCLLALRQIELVELKWRRWAVPLALGIGLMSGHFLVYPPHIAQGWDSNLAHWAYFRLDDELQYAPVWEDGLACSDFPLLGSRVERYLEDGIPHNLFENLHDAGWENCTCILYSNVSNGFSDEQLLELKDESKWKRGEGGSFVNVELGIYRRVK